MAGAVSRAGNSQEGTCHPFASAAHVNSNVEDCINSADSQNQGGNLQAEVPGTGSIEEQARRWFLQGVGFERHGDLYDAVRCYRRAVQLVPDIEYKISQGLVEDSDHSDNDSDTDDESIERDDDEESNLTEEDPVLMTRFLKQIEERGWTFFQQKMDSGKSHINDLPVEVISYILRYLSIFNSITFVHLFIFHIF
jgi:F-box protein 9